jgi:metallophosphoesterase (TIGR00282 family)
VITLGNHTWRRSEINSYLESSERVIRPANFSKFAPGRGLTVAATEDGTKVAVINVMGSLFLSPAIAMFEVIDKLVEEAQAQTPVILVDVHAEATSEKVALGWYLDGRVTAVVGTHTHVPTADARVLPGGTAYITDVGMTGARGGVIGVRREQSIAVMRTHMPMRYDSSDEDPWLNAVVVRADGRRAGSIEQLLRPGSAR